MRQALNRAVNNGSTKNPTGTQWHHIVELTRGAQKFGQNAVNSMANIVPTPTAIHIRIGVFSSSAPPWVRTLSNGNFKTVRDFVSSKSWEQQYRIGLEIWKHAMDTGGQMSQATLKKIVTGT